MRESSPPPYVGPPPVPKMPAGLVELVEGLTREVLKNNPKDLYGFCAKHLEKLLEVRDGRPVRNPVLTLEEKILEAQVKVRQKAKERRERYDREFNALGVQEHRDVTDKNTISNSVEEIIKTPLHQDNKLLPDSEVEIAHECLNDETSVEKRILMQLPEITIFKPDDNPSDYQQVIGNEETSNETNNHKLKLLPDSADINVTKNKDIHDLSAQKNNTMSTLNEQVKEDKNIGKDEKLDINLKDSEESKEPIDSDIETVRQTNITPSTDKTQSNANGDCEITTITAGATDVITETKNSMITDDLQENLDKVATDENEIDVQIEDTRIVEEIDIESIESKVVPDYQKQPDDNEHDCQKLLLTESIISANNDLDYDDNGTFPSENAITNDKVSVEINKHANETNVIGEISIDSKTKEEVKPEDNKTTKNVIESIHKEQESEKNKTLETFLKDESEKVESKKNEVPATAIEANDKKVNTDENKIAGNDVEVKYQKVKSEEKQTLIDVTNNEEMKSEETLENNIEAKNDSLQSDLDMNTKYIDPTVEVKHKEEEIKEKNQQTSGKLKTSDNDNINDDKDDQTDQSNMDLETAAVTIQKVFRSFLFKSRNSTFDDITNEDNTSLEEDSDKKEDYYAVKDRRHLGINRMDTVLQTVNEEKSLSLSTDDSSTLSSAATTIQAHVRGFLVRNRLNSNKTVSTTSLANSNETMEFDTDQQKNKTVLNIHIVPEEANYLSRDESIITSMELSLDGSPPSSISLHPLSYDVSERRKLLKREDAVQSISPPSNNSGKLSEESVKEVYLNDDTLLVNDDTETIPEHTIEPCSDSGVDSEIISTSSTVTATTVINVTDVSKSPISEMEGRLSKSLQKLGSDESDVVTPYDASPRSSIGDYENTSKLVHSGEFHDVLLPTRVSRSDTTVVREFKNVLVYFFIWNHSQKRSDWRN